VLFEENPKEQVFGADMRMPERVGFVGCMLKDAPG
jgi:hypothetical protein